jgi:hypothetical protein
MVNCELCGVRVKPAELAAHVWQSHVKNQKCWCGAVFPWDALARGLFDRHVRRCGGYLAHYLECKLA